ncbi:2317_t:CDS:2, partial [Gigaspora rosea]
MDQLPSFLRAFFEFAIVFCNLSEESVLSNLKFSETWGVLVKILH